MPVRTNQFKKTLATPEARLGLWVTIGSPVTTEICAGSGFDWLLVDAEHGVNDLASIQAQLQAVSGYPDVSAVVRVPTGRGEVGEMLVKQYLDLGAQSILVPMVDTAEQAERIVQAARYPGTDGTGGTRGIGGARAARWGRDADYLQQANAEVCIIVQAETALSLDNLEEIVAVEGVDGVLIGPSDLSASLGHLGDAAHPDVLKAIDAAIGVILAGGKAAGIMTLDDGTARMALASGATFVAVGTDAHALAAMTSQMHASFADC